MKVLILAAGYAVRLGELTANTPKPLLLINGKSIIDRITDKVLAVKSKPVSGIIVVTNGKFFERFDAWRDASNNRDIIRLVNDHSTSNDNRLGAIKDIELAIEEADLDEDLLVVAGDNLFDLDLNRFFEFAAKNPDSIAVALYDIRSLEAAKKYGVIKLDEESRIVDFQEKPERPNSTLVSTGIYYSPKNKLALIREYVKMQDKKLDAPGYYISWVSKVDKVYGFKFPDAWYDIGDIDSYKEADRKTKEREGE